MLASFLTLRNESKIILCFKRCPKDCCLAHMRRKIFNIKGGGRKASDANSILVEGYCKNVHTRLHAHTQDCSYTHACMPAYTYVCMHAHANTPKHLYIYILTRNSLKSKQGHFMRYNSENPMCRLAKQKSNKENLANIYSLRRVILEKLINHRTLIPLLQPLSLP